MCEELNTRTGKKSFAGGYVFRNFIGAPHDKLVELGIPGRAAFRLVDGQGAALVPTVKKGLAVRAGQVLGQAAGRDAFVLLSSVSGTVESLRSVNGVQVVTVVSDATDGWDRIEAYIKTAGDPSPELIETILAQSGIAGIPTRFGTAAIGAADVNAVIINGMGADAYNPSIEVLAGSRLPEIARTIYLLRRIYPSASFSVAFNEDKSGMMGKLKEAVGGDSVSWHPLKPKFPQQLEELLMPVVLGKPFPFGHRAINAGVLVIDLQTALAINDAVVLGKPAIERIVALCGPGFTENIHVRARIGTAISEITGSRIRAGSNWRLVENSLILGSTIEDPSLVTVGRDTSAIIAISEEFAEGTVPFMHPGLHHDSYSRVFASSLVPASIKVDTNIHGEERACLSCGFCEDVCPSRIMPNLLHRYIKRGVIDESLVRYKIHRCIDCNLCSYVCTSKIDVAALMREGKQKLRAEGLGEPEPYLINVKLKGIAGKDEQQ